MSDLEGLIGRLRSPQQSTGTPSTPPVTSNLEQNTTHNLLNLLRSTQPAQSPSRPASAQVPSIKSPDTSKEFLLNLLVKPKDAPSRTASEAPAEAAPAVKPSMFNYINPFEQLHSTSPMVTPAPKAVEIDEGKSQSVAQALEGVGEQVEKEVEHALARVDAQQKAAASDAPVASAVTGDNTIDDKPNDKKATGEDEGLDSSWESAEDEENERAAEDSDVEVFNFPMKPFVAIQIKERGTPRMIRQENFMVIAQLKKDFDQVDRCLVTASQSHIIYAQVATKKDSGFGFRIIRQDTGDHKQVFRSSGERVFSVQLCNSPGTGSDVETVIGTGVDGTIFWTTLAKSRGDLFADDDVESQGFIMPPIKTAEEQASGAQVKTRAKMSSRHPEFFGVSRGKQIYIIAPEIVMTSNYLNPRTVKVDSDKYFAEQTLVITTGKAGKDFCFSEDDTVIVSLDKSGRIKFWNIKDLTAHATVPAGEARRPVEVAEPLWTLNAAASGSRPDEKPSVSSIMLLDKERPTTKGVALRYVLVGFKQNHILQLWDLGLGKAVQEIRLPHRKDSDGICSITYHPRSGIIAIGHPTRNSIYFIHLSAPKYNIAPMDQAKYITSLARGDPSLPRPESTAIMSGLREFSLSRVGELRSLDMLRQPVENASDPNSDDAPLFELYVMHSKGVVGISVKRKDLGWDKDSKLVRPVDALQAGVIEVRDLVPPQKPEPSPEPSTTTETPSRQMSRAASNKFSEPSKPDISPLKSDTLGAEPLIGSTSNGTTKAARTLEPEQGSMQIPEAPLPSNAQAVNPPLMTPRSYEMTAQGSKTPTRDQNDTKPIQKETSSAEATPIAPHISSADDFQALLSKQFDSLYHRIDVDRRAQDAAGAVKQEAVLRLVSQTLTENVEQSLNRIVSTSIRDHVMPGVIDDISRTVDNQMAKALPSQVGSSVSRELKAALPGAIQLTLNDAQVHRMISDQVASKVQHQVSQTLKELMPKMVTEVSSKMVSDLDRRTTQQLRDVSTHRQQDNTQIEELSRQIQSLSKTMQQMAQSQAAFQEQVLRMQQEAAASVRQIEAAPSAAVEQPKPDDPEVAKIVRLLNEGQYDAATIEWLQSHRQGELFDNVFVRINPLYLQKVAPLVALSVSAAVTASFETHVMERLDWLGIVLANVDFHDAEIKEVTPRIMDVLSQRLQGAYMAISEVNVKDPALRSISTLNKQVNEVKRLTE